MEMFFLLSYARRNSTRGMILQSLGKPSAQQEDDSIEVLERVGMRGEGGGKPIVFACSDWLFYGGIVLQYLG